MLTVREVPVSPLSVERLRRLIEPEAWSRFLNGVEQAGALLDEREFWNVNSTASGGGVAEMLRSWVGLARGLGVGMRWVTIAGTPEFFTLTKRLHNFLHGAPGDGGELGEEERAIYERASRANAEAVLANLGPRDVVLLHDPQTAGMVPRLAESGRTVIWRCHVGADESNEYSRAAWDFLEPYIARADACVFSREAYVPPFCREMLTVIVPPSIDAMSPKNQDIGMDTVEAILGHVGLLAGARRSGGRPEYTLSDGTTAWVRRRCEVISAGPLPGPDDTVVVQVSRWDRLKDPVGVIRGFEMVALEDTDAHLVLAGPSLGSVSDDPEGAAVFAEAESKWRRLPLPIRSRVHLACLPMEDLDENAVIVNALQRQATIVVQKSLMEGFGLTVTEAMWKARPVIASAIGGIRDQIEDGVTGVLLADPHDTEAFGVATLRLLKAPAHAKEIGVAARESVRASFLEDRHTLQYVDLLKRLLT
jgi:trehalose synthase